MDESRNLKAPSPPGRETRPGADWAPAEWARRSVWITRGSRSSVSLSWRSGTRAAEPGDTEWRTC